VFSPEHRAKLVATQIRKRPPISLEHRAALSKAHRGVPKSPGHRAKIGAALRGKHIGVGRKHSPEHRAKISAGRRAYFARRTISGCPNLDPMNLKDSVREQDRQR
jgi:hypothetical protein